MNSVISWIFKAGATIVMLCGLSTALCDRTRQYPVESDGKVICIDCRVCSAGYEPRVPCGKIIGASVSVGDCDPCNNGTYSSKKDFKACQDCHYKKCFDHQVVEGTCTDKNDLSRCTDECEEGYSMNNGGTVCDIDLPQQNKTTTMDNSSPSNNSPTSLTTTRNTSKLVVLHDRTDIKESKLDSGVIAGIVIGVIGIVIIFIISICWYKSRNTEQGDKDDKESQVSATESLDKPDPAGGNVKFSKQDTEKNDSANTSSTSLDEGTGPFSQQEECQHNDLLTSDGRPHLKETTQGFVNSNQPSNVPNDVSDISMDSIATQNSLEMSPAPPATFPNPFSSIVNPCAHLTRFDHFPCDVYQLICTTFDFGPPGKSWRELAGWLGPFSVIEVKCFESEKSKTDAIIQSWMAKAENTVPKFVEILEERKHGMTYLAGKIRATMSNVN